MGGRDVTDRPNGQTPGHDRRAPRSEAIDDRRCRPHRGARRAAIRPASALRARRGLLRGARRLHRRRPRARRRGGRPSRRAAPADGRGRSGGGRDQEHGGRALAPGPRDRSGARPRRDRPGATRGPHGGRRGDRRRRHGEPALLPARRLPDAVRRARRVHGGDRLSARARDRRHRAARPRLAGSPARAVTNRRAPRRNHRRRPAPAPASATKRRSSPMTTICRSATEARAAADADLYARGAATLLGSWAAIARGSPGAAVVRRVGVAAAVFPAEPERSIYNNALLERDQAPAERTAALDAMEAAYAAAGVTRFAAWAHESDHGLRADLVARGYAIDTVTRAMGMALADLRVPRPEIALERADWPAYLRYLDR